MPCAYDYSLGQPLVLLTGGGLAECYRVEVDSLSRTVNKDKNRQMYTQPKCPLVEWRELGVHVGTELERQVECP